MESIYGEHLPRMQALMDSMMEYVVQTRRRLTAENGVDPIEHCSCRIKAEDSMREKCRRQGLPETAESALTLIHDAIGLRVVCAFVSDVYAVRDALQSIEGAELYNEKDYIRHAKPNGYRSYHMILKVQGYFVEIQLRTIAMDTWAALEHHLKYKKDTGHRTELIVSELKRCSDELAATDMSLQTIRDMIFEEWEGPKQ